MDMDPGSMTSIPQYIIAIVLLLFGGAYFAAAETAFASINPIRVISSAQEGNKKAKKALYILDHFDETLTAILIGNNIMHIGCSSVITLMVSRLWGNAYVTVATFITAFAVFILAEMIPKSYAKACNERLVQRLAPSLLFLIKMLTPLVFIFSGISNAIGSLVGVKEGEDVTLSEEEVFDIIENIDEEDKIEEDTTELVQSALEFTERTAKDIITPWEKVLVITADMTDDDILELIQDTHFSRLPVLDRDGEPVGILLIRRFLRAKLKGRKVLKSRNTLDALHFVDASLPIDQLLENMSKSRTHMAFVKDEAGKILGILTIEDILEELVGEIYDEEETEDAE